MHPVKAPSSCLRNAFRVAVGFHLASSSADVLALWPAEQLWSGQTGVQQFFFYIFCFKKKALILLSGSESHILQCDASPEVVGGGNSWQQEGEEEGATVFTCVLDWLVELKTSLFEGYNCTVLRSRRDRRVTGEVIGWRVVTWAVKRCFLFGSVLRHRVQWQCLSGHTELMVGGDVYESRESASCGGSTLISSVSSVSSLGSSVSSPISSSASSSSSSSLAMSWRASLMFRPSL